MPSWNAIRRRPPGTTVRRLRLESSVFQGRLLEDLFAPGRLQSARGVHPAHVRRLGAGRRAETLLGDRLFVDLRTGPCVDVPAAREDQHASADRDGLLVVSTRTRRRRLRSSGVGDVAEHGLPRANIDALGRLAAQNQVWRAPLPFRQQDILLVAAADDANHLSYSDRKSIAPIRHASDTSTTTAVLGSVPSER